VRTSSTERIEKLTTAGLWGHRTLHGLLAQQVLDHPDTLAVADQPDKLALTGSHPARVSFQTLDIASDALAVQLLERGIGPDSRVMVQLPNIAELVVCFFAISKLGAIISPLPVQYGSFEIDALGRVFRPDLFIGCRSFKGQDIGQRARDALSATPFADIHSDLRCLEIVRPAHAAEKLNSLDRAVVDDANHIITVCWTSGTTGTPKGVPRSHNMWMATAQSVSEASGYQSGERLLNPFPLVNMAAIGGFLYAAASLGCSLVLHHPLDPQGYLAQLQQEQIQFTIAPPALLNQLAHRPELWSAFDFSALRAIGSGSAPLSPEMIQIFEQTYNKPIVNFYGSNEGISLYSTPDTTPSVLLRASCFPRFGEPNLPWQGYTQTASRSQLIDPDSGQIITRPGIPGELCIDGPTVFDGYVGIDNADLFTQSGYFRTGDLVEICGESAQYYRIVGRCKDIINRGGMKISPSELDTLLELHPGVAEAAVCGYPDPILGERVCACIVNAPNQPRVSLASLCAFLTEQGVATFKLPERLRHLDTLPRNPMNKVIRSELQIVANTQEEPAP